MANVKGPTIHCNVSINATNNSNAKDALKEKFAKVKE